MFRRRGPFGPTLSLRPRMGRHGVRACAIFLACAGCSSRGHGDATAVAPGHPAPAPGVSASPSPARATAAASHPAEFALDAPDAFELVGTSDGALLVWAAPGSCERGWSLQRLGADGARRGTPTRGPTPACGVDPGGEAAGALGTRITEVAAAAGGGRVGVAWIAERGSSAEVFGSHAADGAERFAPPALLASSMVAGSASRARVQLSASETGQLRVGFREADARCSARAGLCSRYLTRPLPDPRPADGRGVEAREIPVPCERMIAGGVWVGGTWYDGVCALDPGAATHVFAIRPEISYAEAVRTLEGCEPLGIAPGENFAVAWGRCDDGIAARMLSPVPARDKFVRQAMRALTCRDGRPLARVRGADGAGFEVAFGPPRARVEAYLPEDFASAAARAVWTGEALVVARPVSDGVVRVEAWHCAGEALVRASP